MEPEYFIHSGFQFSKKLGINKILVKYKDLKQLKLQNMHRRLQVLRCLY